MPVSWGGGGGWVGVWVRIYLVIPTFLRPRKVRSVGTGGGKELIVKIEWVCSVVGG